MTSLAETLKNAGALKVAKKAAKSLPGPGKPPALFGFACLISDGTVVGADVLVFESDKPIGTGTSKSAPLRYLKSQKHWRTLQKDAEKELGKRLSGGEKATLQTATGVIVNANGRHVCVLAGSGIGPGDFKKGAKNLDGPAKSKFGGMPVVKWNKLSALLASVQGGEDEESTEETSTEETTPSFDESLFEGMTEEEAEDAREAMALLTSKGASGQLAMLKEAAKEVPIEMSPPEEVDSMLPLELVGPLSDLFPNDNQEDVETIRRHEEAADQARRSVARLQSEFDDLLDKILTEALAEVNEDQEFAESLATIARETLPQLMLDVVIKPTEVLLGLIRSGSTREARKQLDRMRVGLGSSGKLGQLEGIAGQFGGAFSAAELLDNLSNLIED